MIFSCVQTLFFTLSGFLSLCLGLICIKIFRLNKFIKLLFLLLWSMLGFGVMCFCLAQNTPTARMLYHVLTVFFLCGFLCFLSLIFLIRKYPRLRFFLYDFFLFFKSKLIKDTQLSYDKFFLFKHYIRYFIRYFFALEFIKTPVDHTVRKDKLFNYKLFFVNYGSMFVIFNEIFGHEIYKFSSDTDEPFIIDCGSNIGLATLYFKICYPKARIIGFEASPDTFEFLNKNVTENNLSNVMVYNKALHNKEDNITFYSCKENAATGGWSVMGSTMNQSYEKHAVQVQAMPLSPYIDKPVDLLKIDIEGAENLVLEELAQSGKLKLVKQMILEYHHHMVDVNEDCLSKILKMFEDNGFGYQFNSVEKAEPRKKNRNVLILYVYNKKFIRL